MKNIFNELQAMQNARWGISPGSNTSNLVTYTDDKQNPPKPKDADPIRKLKAHIDFIEKERLAGHATSKEQMESLMKTRDEVGAVAKEDAKRLQDLKALGENEQATKLAGEIQDQIDEMKGINAKLKAIKEEYVTQDTSAKSSYQSLKGQLQDKGVHTKSDIPSFDK
jgi:hypothetical protein